MKRKIKYEFVGAGCVVQFIALALLFFWPIGTFAGVILFFVGSNMSKRYLCGACGHKLESKEITLCPTCKETVETK